MDDLISRQAAIDAICEHGTDLERRGITVLSVANHKQVTVDLLEKLPSAERQGRWEKIELSAPSGDYVMFQCSECASLYYEPSSYCPNCGSFNGKDNLNEKL